MACKSGIQRISETSLIDTICQFYSPLQVNYHIMSTKSEDWGGGGHLQSENWPPRSWETPYKIYMVRFPITNGIQRAYSCSQSINFQHLTCRNVKRTSHKEVKNDRMCRGQFLENGWKKQNANYRDSSTAQVEFKSTKRSKIGSFYEEIFQHKGTVPNDQNDPFSGSVSKHNSL